MKRLFVLLMAVSLAACAVRAPVSQEIENSEFTRANYAAADKLLETPTILVDKSIPLLVATVVNIDSLTQSSRFGRLISEQIATRLTQRGFNVVEMKLRNDVYIREGTGELLLSRDVRDLSKNYNAQVVVVGNYAVAAGATYMTIKAVSVADNRVIGAVNYLLPLTDNNKALLGRARD